MQNYTKLKLQIHLAFSKRKIMRKLFPEEIPDIEIEEFKLTLKQGNILPCQHKEQVGIRKAYSIIEHLHTRSFESLKS